MATRIVKDDNNQPIVVTDEFVASVAQLREVCRILNVDSGQALKLTVELEKVTVDRYATPEDV